jgi:N-acetylmuramoyl-L-alanine amidase
LFLGIIPLSGAAQKILNIRTGDQGSYARLVIDSQSKPNFKSSLDDDGKSINVFMSSVDFENFTLPRALGIIKNIEVINLPNGMGQVSLKLKSPGKIKQKLTLAPNSKINHFRYVLDIISTKNNNPTKVVERKSQPKKKALKAPKKKVVVIDPGHGGKDPGAIGRRGIKEKEVTLGVALQLEKHLKATGLFDVYLTRRSDKFLRLGNRVAIARQHKADFFISLHADSNPRRDTRGLSVYTLSRVASDKEAEKLAIKENKADLIDGVDLNTESPEVANILIDLVKRETMNLSAQFAHKLIKNLSKRVLLLRNTHRFANFAVLRTPDLPGVLIEMGYISNRQDEKLLTTPKYCKRLCEGIVETVKTYFSHISA